jgi:glycyl-tRNA synthetase beta chain
MTYQLESGCALPGWSSVSFVRPAHGLVALHGSDRGAGGGAGPEGPGNSTQGHRFEAAVSPVVITHADDYAATLARDGAVIASFAERGRNRAPVGAACAVSVADARAIEDDALLDEVTALVERPNVLVCEFEKQFLDVPQECLILTMKANQKYFPLLDAAGKLTQPVPGGQQHPPVDDASAVIGGNERVVRPRLADAKFFFDQDRKKTLESRVAGLGKVVYHNKLGTQGERVARVRAMATAIGGLLGDDALARRADQAAQLAKTDLLTDMVGEFPSCRAPWAATTRSMTAWVTRWPTPSKTTTSPALPATRCRATAGVVVALADKLETLAGHVRHRPAAHR